VNFVTESEWLGCTDPKPMLRFLLGKASNRKFRLFTVACSRRIWHLLSDERSRKAVDIAEKVADGLVSNTERGNAATEAIQAAWDLEGNDPSWPAEAAFHTVDSDRVDAQAAAHYAAFTETDESAQAALLRDIMGNPFRLVTTESSWAEWNNGIVLKLAQGIYEDQAFDRLPVVADALEDAGCTDATILDHCRLLGNHVRGCWVIDRLLGKE
jgi:hypothetical protein